MQALASQATLQEDDLSALLAREAYLRNQENHLGLANEVDNALRSGLATPFFGHNLTGYGDWILSSAFSPNGQLLATGDSNNRIFVWNLSNLDQEPTILSAHENWVWAVAFSPNGKKLASGSLDKTVQVWNIEHLDSPPTLLKGHSGEVYAVAFAPDGSTLASASANGEIRLWNMNDLDAQPVIITDTTGILAMAYTPDGN